MGKSVCYRVGFGKLSRMVQGVCEFFFGNRESTYFRHDNWLDDKSLSLVYP